VQAPKPQVDRLALRPELRDPQRKAQTLQLLRLHLLLALPPRERRGQ
jgi:hypothetical protein